MATGDPPGAALASSAPSAEGTSASVAELARAKARIEELERLVGRQQLDLDFFRKALRLADALQGPAPARGETTLRAHQRFERGGKVWQGENETTSAPEKAIHEVQHLCQSAQLSRAGYYRHLAPRKSEARRRRHSRCDPSHRTVRPLLRLSPDR